MLEKILSKPVQLNIDGKLITFNSLNDFEFALNTRTLLPQKRMTEALNATSGELSMELNTIDVAIEQISDLMNQSSVSGEVTHRLKAINPVIFSNDNNWRDIFFALKKHRSNESSKYKLIALTAYLQYLTNRHDLIQTVKTRLEKNTDKNEKAEDIDFKTGELDIDDSFDAGVLAKQLGMKTMPKAEYVEFELDKKEELTLLLANYKCKLIFKDNGIKFVDTEKEEHPMIIGLNKIGRGRECNVRFTDTMQRISRLHLMVINHDNNKLELTDLSTYGTFYLKKSS